MAETMTVLLPIALIVLLFLLISYQLHGRQRMQDLTPGKDLDELEARNRAAESARKAPLGWQDPDGDARAEDMDRLGGCVGDDAGLGVIAIILIALSQAIGGLLSRGKR